MDFTILNNLSSESIIFGGLTIISLALVILVWRIIVRCSNHTNDVIGKNTDAWIAQAKSHTKNALALKQNTLVMDKLVDVIERKLK